MDIPAKSIVPFVHSSAIENKINNTCTQLQHLMPQFQVSSTPWNIIEKPLKFEYQTYTFPLVLSHHNYLDIMVPLIQKHI